MRKFTVIKKKSLFIPDKLHSITISSVIDYILEVHSISSSLKRKKKSQESKRKGKRDGKRRTKGKRWKIGEEEKSDGKILCVRKGKRDKEIWKKRRKRGRKNGREGEGEEKEMKRKKNRK